jgi:hypothetical protein
MRASHADDRTVVHVRESCNRTLSARPSHTARFQTPYPMRPATSTWSSTWRCPREAATRTSGCAARRPQTPFELPSNLWPVISVGYPVSPHATIPPPRCREV